LPILKEKGMKPSYMAIKKALYGRQPGSVFTLDKIKYQVLPILDVLRLQYLFGVSEICATLSGAQKFLFFFCNSYGHA
jgi:hypothetical protein